MSHLLIPRQLSSVADDPIACHPACECVSAVLSHALRCGAHGGGGSSQLTEQVAGCTLQWGKGRVIEKGEEERYAMRCGVIGHQGMTLLSANGRLYRAKAAREPETPHVLAPLKGIEGKNSIGGASVSHMLRRLSEL